MTYDIRPLSFGEILDRAFRVYLDHFWLLFGISAVVIIPSSLLLATAPKVGVGVSLTVDALFIFVAGPTMHAVLTFGVAEAYLERSVTIGKAYQSLRSIFLIFIGTYLLFNAILLAPAAIVGLPIVAFAASRDLPALAVLAVIVIVAVIGYFAVRWSLIIPAMILEHRFGVAALRRSKELIEGSWWPTFGILFAAIAIANVPAIALRFAWSFIPVIGKILTATTNAASSGYIGVAWTIYYFDRRCRLEEFDLRLLAEQIRAQSPRTIETASEASAPA